MKSSIYSYLADTLKNKGAAFLALIDPDIELKLEYRVSNLCSNGVDAILIGGSIIGRTDFNSFVKFVKSLSTIPIIIFPGNSMQLSSYADAILFLSLVSGRNSEYLIGEQVKAAPIIKEIAIEAIPTGYIIIESGSVTSVLYMSHTIPIPNDKPDIAKYHALASEYLGMKLVYLDAGSGAKYSVPTQMIKEVSEYITLPLIIGGGIRTPAEANSKVSAGANAVVVGNILQSHPELTKDFADAIHNK